jgi:hypothetical protein
MPKIKVASALKKIASGTVTLEEGAVLLNDLERSSADKDELNALFLELYRALPQETHGKIFLHIIALTKNPHFENMLAAGLDHPDENTAPAILAGMAGYKDDQARGALKRQLAHPLPRVRKLAGEIIIRKWGTEGVNLVVANGLCSEDQDIVNSACIVLSDCGVTVAPIVIDAMQTMNMASLRASAKLLLDMKESMDIEDHIDKDRVATLVQVMDRVAGNKQPNLIITMLELLGLLKNKLAGHEDAIAAFLNVEHSTIKLVSHKVLSAINTDRARGFLSSVKIPLGMGGFIVDHLPPIKE